MKPDFSVSTQFKKYSERHFAGVSIVPEIQFIETRKTFYVAWASCLIFMRDGLGKAEIPEEQAIDILQKQLDEIELFLEKEMQRFDRYEEMNAASMVNCKKRANQGATPWFVSRYPEDKSWSLIIGSTGGNMRKEKKPWEAFEDRIHDETIAQGMTLMKFPLKVRIISGRPPIPMKSHPDFVAGIVGLAAFFDAKTTKEDKWSLRDYVLRSDTSANKLHQWLQLEEACSKGNISGYLVWFQALEQISWVPSETIKNLISNQSKFVTPETPGVSSQSVDKPINLKILMQKDIDRRMQIIRGTP